MSISDDDDEDKINRLKKTCSPCFYHCVKYQGDWEHCLAINRIIYLFMTERERETVASSIFLDKS